MESFKWRCICCEKIIELYPDEHGCDEDGILPCLEGGILEIHFGFGSQFDQIEDMLGHIDYRIQGSICDKCFKKKQCLTRKVMVIETRKYVVESK